MANTYPGTHEAGGSSFARNTLENKQGRVRAEAWMPRSWGGASLPLEAGLECGPDPAGLLRLLTPSCTAEETFPL